MIELECIGQSVAVADPESRLCRRRKSAPSRQRVPLEPVGSAVSTGIEYQIADAPCNRFRSSRCRDRRGRTPVPYLVAVGHELRSNRRNRQLRLAGTDNLRLIGEQDDEIRGWNAPASQAHQPSRHRKAISGRAHENIREVPLANDKRRLSLAQVDSQPITRDEVEPVVTEAGKGHDSSVPGRIRRYARPAIRLVRWLATAKFRQETGTPMEAPGSAKRASELRYHETRDHRFAHAVRAEHHDKEACRLHEPTCLPHQPHCQRQYVARWVLEPKSCLGSCAQSREKRVNLAGGSGLQELCHKRPCPISEPASYIGPQRVGCPAETAAQELERLRGTIALDRALHQEVEGHSLLGRPLRPWPRNHAL